MKSDLSSFFVNNYLDPFSTNIIGPTKKKWPKYLRGEFLIKRQRCDFTKSDLHLFFYFFCKEWPSPFSIINDLGLLFTNNDLNTYNIHNIFISKIISKTFKWWVFDKGP